MGPWSLGRWYRPLAMLCLFGSVRSVIGVQPPNDKALLITFGVAAIMVGFWFAVIRRTFRGPPQVSLE